MKLGQTLIIGSSLLALTYATSVFAQEGRWWGDHHHHLVIQDAEPPEYFNFDFGFEPDIIIGGYALGFYNPEYGYWTGTGWDQDFYSEGHRGYGHYYRGAPESVHQRYNEQGRSHPNEQQRNYIQQKRQNTPDQKGTTDSTERNYHEQRPASQPNEAQQDNRKVEQTHNITNSNKNTNTNNNTKLRAAPPTKEQRAPTEDRKNDKPEKK